jgi:hypothetical protein
MKSRNVLALACLTLLLSISKPDAETALGILLGEPSGISLRIDRFPVMGFGWSAFDHYGHDGRFYLHADYWIIEEQLHVLQPSTGVPDWYLGAGAAMSFGHDFSLGFRIPVGLQFVFREKFELFCEIVPGLRLISDVHGTIAGGIGLRFIL